MYRTVYSSAEPTYIELSLTPPALLGVLVVGYFLQELSKTINRAEHWTYIPQRDQCCAQQLVSTSPTWSLHELMLI